MMIVAWRTAPATVTACSRSLLGAARVVKLARSASPTKPSSLRAAPRSATARQTLTPLPPVVTSTSCGRATAPGSNALDPQGAVEAEVRGDHQHG